MTPRMYKLAATIIEMGEAQEAGKGIADIIRFLMTRIDPEKRPSALNKIRHKIWYLNEYDISNKKTPASASMGQSITFIKTILNGHQPQYIRDVLTSVVKHLY